MVVPGEGTIVTLNHDLTTLPILTFVIGFAITAALVAIRMKGALLLGIIATTVVASIINAIADTAVFPPGVATWPDKVADVPDFSLMQTAMSLAFVPTIPSFRRISGPHVSSRSRPRGQRS